MVGTEGFFVEDFVGGGVAGGFWLVLGSCGVVDDDGKRSWGIYKQPLRFATWLEMFGVLAGKSCSVSDSQRPRHARIGVDVPFNFRFVHQNIDKTKCRSLLKRFRIVQTVQNKAGDLHHWM